MCTDFESLRIYLLRYLYMMMMMIRLLMDSLFLEVRLLTYLGNMIEYAVYESALSDL